MVIPEGKVTAVVGPSGSGKTTLLKLLLQEGEHVETAEKASLQQRQAVENGLAAINRNRIEIAGYRSASLELDRQFSEARRKGYLDLRKAIQAVRSSITSWENFYVIKAPHDGTVSYFRELNPNQHVAAYDPVVAVVPDSIGFMARVKIDQRSAGKVQEGQRVILRFDSYPDREFGTVLGRVASISRLGMADDKDQMIYLLDVDLPAGLKTTYQKRLHFRQELRRDADIVTAERRLVQRLFDQLRPTEDRARMERVGHDFPRGLAGASGTPRSHATGGSSSYPHLCPGPIIDPAAQFARFF